MVWIACSASAAARHGSVRSRRLSLSARWACDRVLSALLPRASARRPVRPSVHPSTFPLLLASPPVAVAAAADLLLREWRDQTDQRHQTKRKEKRRDNQKNAPTNSMQPSSNTQQHRDALRCMDARCFVLQPSAVHDQAPRTLTRRSISFIRHSFIRTGRRRIRRARVEVGAAADLGSVRDRVRAPLRSVAAPRPPRQTRMEEQPQLGTTLAHTDRRVRDLMARRAAADSADRSQPSVHS